MQTLAIERERVPMRETLCIQRETVMDQERIPKKTKKEIDGMNATDKNEKCEYRYWG